MKRFLLAVGLVLLFTPAVSAVEQSIVARVTVYWASGGGGSDRWTRRHICSTGARLRAGHCAVDPRRIPYGSKVTLPDGPLLAVDTGSAVVSRKAARRSGRTPQERSALVIDRFFETKQQALSWAGRNPYFMLVRVSPPDFRSWPVSRSEKAPQVLPPNSRQQSVARSQKAPQVLPPNSRQQSVALAQKAPQVLPPNSRQQSVALAPPLAPTPRRSLEDRPRRFPGQLP